MEYDFGLRLKALREKKHLTQERVGKIIGVSGANISNYENNTVKPPIDAIKKLALLYGVTTDYIFGLNNRKAHIIKAKSEYQQEKIEQLVDLIDDIIKGPN